MIRINLLPHREEKRKARRQQFYAMLGMIAVLAGLIWFLGYGILNGRISAQTEKNDFLKKKSALLDKEIKEIKQLKAQTDALLARKQVIEALQANRAETVHLFNQLALHVPEGIFLTSIKQTGAKVSLLGYAQSNARITTLMNNLDETQLLENSRLIQTQAQTVGNKRLNAFSVETFIARQTTAPPAGKARR